MTPSELYEELRKQGHYVLLSVSIDDALNHFADEELKPSRDEVTSALEHVYRKWPCGDDFMAAMEWVEERIMNTRNQGE